MAFFLKYKYSFILGGFIILLFLLNAYNLTFNLRPTVIHQWRQSDCLSIAKNYYEEGMHFFQPKIHWQEALGGKTVSELPLLNYTTACLWKVFGEHEGVYRLLNYLIFVIALFVLFNTFLYQQFSPFLSFFFISILLSSPILTYYGYNFLADVPALSLGIISFCLTVRFYSNKRLLFFYSALIIGSLAVLLKASAVIPLAILCGLVTIDSLRLNRFFKMENLFGKKFFPIFFSACAIVICGLWYGFAKRYNEESHSAVFLIGVLPIWEMKEQEILTNLSALFSETLILFFNRPILFIFFISVIYVFFNLTLLNGLFKYSFIISAVFFVVYLVLFFKVFDVHDYYLVNLMIFPVITFFCLGTIFLKKNFVINRWLVVSLLLIVVFNSFYSAAFYRMRTIKDDKICYWYPFFSSSEKKLSEYLFWRDKATMGELATLKPRLREMGIKRNDLFVIIPDSSPNSSLYLLDQKGYTVPADLFLQDTLWKVRSNFNNCGYLVLCDPTLKESASFKNIEHKIKKIVDHNNIEVYRLIKN